MDDRFERLRQLIIRVSVMWGDTVDFAKEYAESIISNPEIDLEASWACFKDLKAQATRLHGVECEKRLAALKTTHKSKFNPKSYQRFEGFE